MIVGHTVRHITVRINYICSSEVLYMHMLLLITSKHGAIVMPILSMRRESFDKLAHGNGFTYVNLCVI